MQAERRSVPQQVLASPLIGCNEAATTEPLSDWPQCRPLWVLCSPGQDARLSRAQTTRGGALVGGRNGPRRSRPTCGRSCGRPHEEHEKCGRFDAGLWAKFLTSRYKTAAEETRSQHYHLSTQAHTAHTSVPLRHEAPRLGRLCGTVRHRDVPGLLPLGLRPRQAPGNHSSLESRNGGGRARLMNDDGGRLTLQLRRVRSSGRRCIPPLWSGGPTTTPTTSSSACSGTRRTAGPLPLNRPLVWSQLTPCVSNTTHARQQGTRRRHGEVEGQALQDGGPLLWQEERGVLHLL